MNNKLFIAMSTLSEVKLDELRVRLERDDELFDRHGSAEVAYNEKHFGFSTVSPKVSRTGGVRWFGRFLGCSSIYLPCGWQKDKRSRKAFALAELLNKKIIFEEDGRCR